MDFWGQFWATLVGAVVGSGIGAAALFVVYRLERGERRLERDQRAADLSAEAERRREERVEAGISMFLLEVSKVSTALRILHGWDRVTMPPPATADVGPSVAAINVARLSATASELPLFECVRSILFASERSEYSDAASYLSWIPEHLTDWRTGKSELSEALTELEGIESRAIANSNQACTW